MNKSIYKWNTNNNDDFRVKLRRRRASLGHSYEKTVEPVLMVLELLKLLYFEKIDLKVKDEVRDSFEKYFLSDSYVDFFTKKNIDLDLSGKDDAIKRYTKPTPSTKSPHPKSLDFFAIYLGYAGILGYENNTKVALASCFRLDTLGGIDVIRKIISESKKSNRKFKQLEEKSDKEILGLFYPDEEGKQEQVTPSLTDDSKSDEKNIEPIFSQTDENYNILILPVKRLNINKGVNDEDYGITIARRLKSLIRKDSLLPKVVYWDCNPTENFDSDEAENWKKFHHANLVIFGDYMKSEETDMVQITLNYIGDEKDLPIAKYKRDELNYQLVNQLELTRGAVQGDIDFIIYFLTGLAAYKKKNYAEAITNLLRIRRKDNSIHIDYCLGAAFINVLDVESAEKCFREYIKSWSLKDISTLSLKINLANAHLFLKEYEKAVEYYVKVTEINQNIAEVWYNMGYGYQNMGESKLAIDSYKNAEKINGVDANTLNNLGVCYATNMDTQKMAKECFEKALNVNPDLVEAIYNLGLCYFNQANFQEATKYFRKGIAQNPDNANTWILMGLLNIAKNDFVSVKQCLDQANKIKQAQYERWLTDGWNSFMKGHLELAITYYNKALEVIPNDYQTLLYKGLAYSELSTETSSALQISKLEDFESYVKFQNSHLEIKYQAHEKILEEFKPIIKKQSEDNFDKAIECYKTAIDLQKDCHEAWHYMGASYFSKKSNYKKAIECFKNAIQLKPTFFQAWLDLATIYERSRDTLNASKCFKHVFEHELFNGKNLSTTGNMLSYENVAPDYISYGYHPNSYLWSSACLMFDIDNSHPKILVSGSYCPHVKKPQEKKASESEETVYSQFKKALNHLKQFGLEDEYHLKLLDKIKKAE